MKLRRGAAERTGLYVGAVAAAGTVVGLVVMLVLALTGHWS
ncbi:hypothetical protein [Nocardioides ferulae]|nr:hypothetical protein [Nocardioides ferulae]